MRNQATAKEGEIRPRANCSCIATSSEGLPSFKCSTESINTLNARFVFLTSVECHLRLIAFRNCVGAFGSPCLDFPPSYEFRFSQFGQAKSILLPTYKLHIVTPRHIHLGH